ncbi:DnaD domain protein [Heyndrickxia coagulans]|uniref:DnaD domain protein n=1 Tax=Heyndrickxia coagulans TaxID=1398 RepID=UPI002E23CCD1|nr:DnaD domain protein [Heyndrickxia coagulans]
MNYIKELNAFYDWLEINELSPSAINLWYALMHINNKAGWAETFTVAESVLCVKTGLTDRTLRKVRNELKQKGRIDFLSRKGGKAPIYKVISFFASENNSVQKESAEINSADGAGDSAEGRSKGSTGGRSTLNKQNETKQNETIPPAADRRVNYFDTYMLCFGGQPSALQIQEINYLIDIKGLTEEVVCIAFKKAAEVGAKYSYARTILNSWADAGIKTASDVEREQKEFEQRQQNKPKQYRRGKPGRVEKLPDWFKKEPEDHTPETTSSEDGETLEEKRRRLEKIRASYKKAGS